MYMYVLVYSPQKESRHGYRKCGFSGSSVYMVWVNIQCNMPNIENQFMVGDNLFVGRG